MSSGYPNVDLIIWPESALPILLEDSDQTRKDIMDSIDGDSKLLAGSIRVDQNGSYTNSALLIDDNSNINLTYDKIFGEYLPFNSLGISKFLNMGLGFSKGKRDNDIKLYKNFLASPMICFESIFDSSRIKNNLCSLDLPKLDYIYIDGGHSYQQKLADLEEVEGKVIIWANYQLSVGEIIQKIIKVWFYKC